MSEKIVILKAYSSLPEAEIVKSLLEQNGISAHLADKHFNTAYGGALGSITGGYRIRVSESDLERAQGIINEVHPQEFQVEGPPCPQCQSTKTELHYKSSIWILDTLLILLLLLPSSQHIMEDWSCESCKNKWRINNAPSVKRVFVYCCVLFYLGYWAYRFFTGKL